MDWILAGAVATIVALAARTIISYDSFLYLSSAKSLFSTGFVEFYHWIREPGYPLVLRSVHEFLGNADIWVIGVQSIAAVGSAALLFNAWFPDRAVPRRVGVLIASLNPIVVGFVGWVGQQIWFLAIVCALAAVVAHSTRPSAWRLTQLVIVAAVVAAAAALFSVLLIGIIGAAALVLATSSIHRRRAGRDDYRVPGIVAVVVSMAFLLTLSSWWIVKAAVLDEESSIYGTPAWVWQHVSSPDATSTPSGLPSKILTFLAVGQDGSADANDAASPHRALQLKVFGGVLKPYSSRCGFTFDGPPAAVEYSDGFLTTTCRPEWTEWSRVPIDWLGLQSYRIALLAALLSPVVAVAHRPSRVPALLVFGLLAPYVVSSGSSISRYAMPVYPIGVLLLILWIAPTISRSRWRSS